MIPPRHGDDALSAPAPARSRARVQQPAPQPIPVHTPQPAFTASGDSAFYWRPTAEDQHDFGVEELRTLSEMSGAGRSGMRRAWIKQKQDQEVLDVERGEARAEALSALLAQQRRQVIATLPKDRQSSGALARQLPKKSLRPKSLKPAFPIADNLWHVALMTAELGYNALDLNISGGSLRFDTIDPQLVNTDRLHYQTPLAEVRVQSYVALAPHLLSQRIGVLACRDDDSLWVIDGQHHTAAAVRSEIDLMGYWIFDSSGYAEERRVFQSFQAWKRGMGLAAGCSDATG